MNRLIRCTIVVCLGLIVVLPAAAEEEGISDSLATTVEKQIDPLNGERRFARKFEAGDKAPVPLPTPVDPVSLLGTSSQPGPVGIGEISTGAERAGGALISPRGGGSISTPRQRADREIRKLIRKLG